MKNKCLTSILIITLLATISLLTWRFEIIYIVGWSGLAWIEAMFYSPIITSALVAIAIVTPFNIYLANRITVNKTVSLILLFVFGVFSYTFGKMVIIDFYKSFIALPVELLLITILTPIIIAFVICLIVRLLLIKVSWWYAVRIFLAIGATLLCSSLFHIDTVKEGAPFFWIVFFCGITSLSTARRMSQFDKSNLELDNNILDDELISQTT